MSIQTSVSNNITGGIEGMIAEGYSFKADDGHRATWEKRGIPQVNEMTGTLTNGRTTVITLNGPNRHTGEIMSDFNGNLYIG